LNLKQTDVGKKTSRFDWQRGAKHHTRVESSMQKTKTAHLKKNRSPDTLTSGFNRLRSALRAMDGLRALTSLRAIPNRGNGLLQCRQGQSAA
jgi:hypothetical protein